MTRSIPLSRHERRRIERDERKAHQKRERQAPRRISSMVLLTGAALLIGVVIVGFAFLQQPAAPSTALNDLTAPVAVVPAGISDGRTLGSANAPVTMEIWSDFQCPACRSLVATIEPQLIQQYVVPGTVKLVYHDAAFQGARGSNPAYDESVEAAAAARCAADQGYFWQMHDWIFANWAGENKGAYRAERLRAMAGAVGLDLTAYDSCLAVGDKQAAARAETAQGVAAGVSSTPTLVINGKAIAGVPTYSQLINLIAQAAGASK